MYHNNGNNTFTEQTSIHLAGVWSGTSTWGDYDNDGNLDIYLAGNGPYLGNNSKIYRNNGDNTFSEQTSILLDNGSSVTWGDYDNDGDQDLLLTGSVFGTRISEIYNNNTYTPNNLPSSPSNLKTIVNGNNVTFSWDKSTDNETPQNGLTYNLIIGTNTGACNILSPMSDRNTGNRRVVSMGNAGHCNSKTIKGLTDGQYYWSVQAIDNNFAGSKFAPEQITSIFTCALDLHPVDYELSYLDEGNKYYIDRDFTLETIPNEYKGFYMIKTRNDDKKNTGLDFHFNLCSSADIYIAYDYHLTSPPSWLTSNYTNTGKIISVIDFFGEGHLDIWKSKQIVQPGVVTCGDNGGIDNSSMYFVFYNNVTSVKLRIFLQGPYTSGGMMTTTLRDNNLIPTTSPYQDVSNNSQFYNSTTHKVVVPYSIPSNITDWVQIEIRSNTTNIVESKSCFLRKDGQVIDPDGLSDNISIGSAVVNPNNTYYIVLKHRNHLAVMSSDAVELNGLTTYDFTTSESQAYIKTVGSIPMADLGGGKYGMWAGDVSGDGILKYNLSNNDRDLILQKIGGSNINATVDGYFGEDVNMDGTVKYNLSKNDRDIILVNIGGANINAIRTTQVP